MKSVAPSDRDPGETADAMGDLSSLIVILKGLVEDGPGGRGETSWPLPDGVDRWEDREHIYIEAGLPAASIGSSMDLCVQGGRVYIRIAK